MKKIQVNVNDVYGTVSAEAIKKLAGRADDAINKLNNGTGAGNDFLGWVNLPSSITPELLGDINATANALKENCEVVVAVGIGGSYLGAKAVIEALSDSFASLKPQTEWPRVVFAGQNIGEDYLAELKDYLSDKKFGIIVISKSGTTTEPAIAFRILKEMLEAKLGKAEAAKR
ncbi:MAG: glucose-6-phosphate isomerase, partial [Muribaculaceae bacterium]|nr:glucose-6-phosphate isomerase [Muribaculaceae bacterium]